MTRHEPLPLATVLAALALLLLLLVVLSRCLAPAVADVPATPTPYVPTVIVISDPTPRIAGSPRPHWSPTPAPERILNTPVPPVLEMPTSTPTPTPEPTKKPMGEMTQRR